MVTFTINIPPMLAHIPYMDPMGYTLFHLFFSGKPIYWVQHKDISNWAYTRHIGRKTTGYSNEITPNSNRAGNMYIYIYDIACVFFVLMIMFIGKVQYQIYPLLDHMFHLWSLWLVMVTMVGPFGIQKNGGSFGTIPLFMCLDLHIHTYMLYIYIYIIYPDMAGPFFCSL